LQSIPINSQTNLWYSVKYESINDQTQKFHQDYDDVKFIKLFIYLSDVKKENGPHTYIKSSRINRKVPKDYKVSKRLDDNYVKKIYKNDIVEFVGEKGTIIFEDTNGFHKGKTVDDGHRIILQLQFATSLLWMNEKVLQTKNVIFQNDKVDFINEFNKVYIKYL
jgi:ectoine hydroxylase-related dioxygenase (phytanoyl-CoA dioxygenase family)